MARDAAAVAGSARSGVRRGRTGTGSRDAELCSIAPPLRGLGALPGPPPPPSCSKPWTRRSDTARGAARGSPCPARPFAPSARAARMALTSPSCPSPAYATEVVQWPSMRAAFWPRRRGRDRERLPLEIARSWSVAPAGPPGAAGDAPSNGEPVRPAPPGRERPRSLPRSARASSSELVPRSGKPCPPAVQQSTGSVPAARREASRPAPQAPDTFAALLREAAIAGPRADAGVPPGAFRFVAPGGRLAGFGGIANTDKSEICRSKRSLPSCTGTGIGTIESCSTPLCLRTIRVPALRTTFFTYFGDARKLRRRCTTCRSNRGPAEESWSPSSRCPLSAAAGAGARRPGPAGARSGPAHPGRPERDGNPHRGTARLGPARA